MISVETPRTLYLGRVGEQNVEPLPFDISPWITKYGQGVTVLTVKRVCDNIPYPVDIATEGNVVTWTVSKKDVESYGTGKAELTYMVDDKIKKSVVYKTYTEKSLADITPTPENGDTWLDAMTKQVLKAEGHSTQSESYAHGGTGARADEETDNAKYYSEQADLDAQTTDADRQVVEQAKTEVLESAKEVGLNKQAVENVAKDVADAEVRINNVENDIKLMQTDVKANKDAVDTAKKAIDASQTDVTTKAKQVATDKDTVVKAVNGFDQKVTDATGTINTAKTKAIEDIDTAKTGAVGAVTAEGNTQVNAVKQEGTTQKKVVDDAVSGIVADRQQIQQNKDDILKNAIKPTATGNPIVLKDSTNFKAINLEITGSTAQDRTPSPENPVEIVNGVINNITWGNGTDITFTETIPPIELSKWDKIKKIDGVWKKENNTEKLKLSPSSSWFGYAGNIGAYQVAKKESQNQKEGYCNVLSYNYGVSSNGIYILDKDVYIGTKAVSDNKLTVEKWKEILTQNDIYIAYGIKTPTYEVLPQETQEVLNKIQTFYPNSTIQTNNGIELNLKYVADTKNYIDNKIASTQALALER